MVCGRQLNELGRAGVFQHPDLIPQTATPSRCPLYLLLVASQKDAASIAHAAHIQKHFTKNFINKKPGL